MYCTFMTASRLILRRMKNFSDKSCVKKQNRHFMFNNTFPGNREVYEVMWKKGYSQTDDTTIRRMRIAYCITKAIKTHSEYCLLFFQGNNGYANASHCYILHM